MTTALVSAARFARVPVAWISLNVSPGAKALLLPLCAAADDRGESWYSYDQLGTIVGRSRAAVAGYVQELRQAGIIATLRQRTANGFNYRLKIRILAWPGLLAEWSTRTRPQGASPRRDDAASADTVSSASASHARQPAPAGRPDAGGSEAAEQGSTEYRSDARATDRLGASAAQETERRVQSAQRMDPSGPINKTHQNYSTAAASSSDPSAPSAEAMSLWSSEDEAEWRRAKHRDNDGFHGFDRSPSDAILEKAIARHAALRDRSDSLSLVEAEAAARAALQQFAKERTLESAEEDIDTASRTLAASVRTPRGLATVLETLAAGWKPHWRRLSTARQIELTVAAAQRDHPEAFRPDPEVAAVAHRAFLAQLERTRRLRHRAFRNTPEAPSPTPASRQLPDDVASMLSSLLGRSPTLASAAPRGTDVARSSDSGNPARKPD